MIIIGLLFVAFVIYQIYCVIENEKYGKQRRKEWEQALASTRPRQQTEYEKMIREKEEENADIINPWTLL